MAKLTALPVMNPECWRSLMLGSWPAHDDGVGMGLGTKVQSRRLHGGREKGRSSMVKRSRSIRSTTMVLFLLLVSAGIPINGGAGTRASAATSPCPYPLTEANRPVAPRNAPDDLATFTDPTAVVEEEENVRVSHKDYIAPFATLEAGDDGERICIEEGSNVQDNTSLIADEGSVRVGEHAIIAHGARLIADGDEGNGGVTIAHHEACDPRTGMLPPPGPPPETWQTPAERGRQALANALAEAGAHYDCDKVPAFIGFNSLNRSHIEDGALLGAASRLQPGVTLRAGYSSYPGKSLNTQAQADTPGDPVTRKVRYVTAGDIVFMEAVLHVNECLAKGYTRMYRAIPRSIYGVNFDPGAFHNCEFNHSTEAPRTLDRAQWIDPSQEEIRIIGDTHFNDTRENILDNIGEETAIRADEGEPFEFGRDVHWDDASTFHALEPTVEDPEVGVNIGDRVAIGEHVVVHGGGRRVRSGGGPDPTPTNILARSELKEWAVVFRSFLDEETVVGYKAVLVGYDTKGPGERIPARCVKFPETPRDQCAYFVEW